MPQTRSSGKQQLSEFNPESDSTSENGPDLRSIQESLSNAQAGVEKLVKRLVTVQTRNKELRAEIARLETAPDVSIPPKRGRMGGTSNVELQRKVRALTAEVDRLKATRAKQKKRIQKLEMEQIEEDAAELANQADIEANSDDAHGMRKLLRRFQDLMTADTIEENETCPICFERMEPRKASSLPCQHVLCCECLSQLPTVSAGPETIKCPHCRQPCVREDAQTVIYTASEQWDALLELAGEWGKVDHRGNEETSDEEAEEAFVDNGDVDASSTLSADENVAHGSMRPDEDEEDEEDTGPSTPSAPEQNGPSYSQSPISLKRKRMAELAEKRKLKKSR